MCHWRLAQAILSSLEIEIEDVEEQSLFRVPAVARSPI